MADPLSTAASAVTLADRAAAVVRWLRGRSTGKRTEHAPPLIQKGSWPFELLPVRFELWLAQQVPSVEVSIYAVNYLKKDLQLRDVRVTLYPGSGPCIENIELSGDRALSKLNSTFITCRRNLLDSEARALLAAHDSSLRSSSIAMAGRAVAGRREYRYGPVSSIVIAGFANRPSPGPEHSKG
jgi:hypothetical protein